MVVFKTIADNKIIFICSIFTAMNSDNPKPSPKKITATEVKDIKDKKEKLVKHQVTVNK